MHKVNEKEYQQWYDAQVNDDGSPCEYGRGVFHFAERWADFMESEIAQGKGLESIAERLSYDADIEQITGFMYGVAIEVLAKHWIHGEQLRRWHNLRIQMNDEGEKANASGGILNPAISIAKE